MARNVASKEAVHLNLGLRRISSSISSALSELTGLTVISNKTRNQILESEPWLASKFHVTEPRREGEGAGDEMDPYLRADHPLLKELRLRYASHPANDHVQWNAAALDAQLNLKAFRSDNIYMYQSRRYPPLAFYATAAYVLQVDQLGLLRKLEEDGSFGAEVFDFHGHMVSRDLLDSIIEINFLERHLALSQWPGLKVLDIGAGYGRLAHRMGTAFSNLRKYYCVDAVPESTFLCDYYLRYRNMTPRCQAVPLDELGRVEGADLAINIHSFPECRVPVVEWWLRYLQELCVPWLFIVTGTNLGLTSRESRGRQDFRGLIEKCGFVLEAKECKFQRAAALEEHGLYPDEYYLFRRRENVARVFGAPVGQTAKE
jgi:hypothetical protein